MKKYPHFSLRHQAKSATSYTDRKISLKIKVSPEKNKKKCATLCSLIKWDALVPVKLINIVTNALK